MHRYGRELIDPSRCGRIDQARVQNIFWPPCNEEKRREEKKMRREKAFFMLTLSSLPLVLLFLVLVLEVKIICSKEISSKDTEEKEHNRRETVANFPTFQNLQGFAQLNTSHAGRND
eukprot:scaffold5144_cov141-Ochromonas_danica.AAC.1